MNTGTIFSNFQLENITEDSQLYFPTEEHNFLPVEMKEVSFWPYVADQVWEESMP